MPLEVSINGQPVTLSGAGTIASLLEERGLKADRVAIERNGEIVSRGLWPTVTLAPGDRLEIVHFVGGGTPVSCSSSRSHRSP